VTWVLNHSRYIMLVERSGVSVAFSLAIVQICVAWPALPTRILKHCTPTPLPYSPIHYTCDIVCRPCLKVSHKSVNPTSSNVHMHIMVTIALYTLLLVQIICGYILVVTLTL